MGKGHGRGTRIDYTHSRGSGNRSLNSHDGGMGYEDGYIRKPNELSILSGKLKSIGERIHELGHKINLEGRHRDVRKVDEKTLKRWVKEAKEIIKAMEGVKKWHEK